MAKDMLFLILSKHSEFHLGAFLGHWVSINLILGFVCLHVWVGFVPFALYIMGDKIQGFMHAIQALYH